MLNRFPYNSGHLLVAPRRHRASPELLTNQERALLAELLARCLTILKKALKPDGFNLGMNLGRVAGAGIPGHLHWHIVPRWAGDTNFMPVVGSTRVISQHLDANFELLKPLFKQLTPALS
jgi:ATP adenylyltransferase